MARRMDSGWRDKALNQWHVDNGFPCPVAGMALPMVEYDRGQSVGLVNYIRRGDSMVFDNDGFDAYRAFGRLYNETGTRSLRHLPFLTAVYDPRNWAMQVFPHNDPARDLVGRETVASDGWASVSEARFASILFGMRGRTMPDMFGYGVDWSEDRWMELEPFGERAELPFSCSDMSARRREYEPSVSAPMRVKLPCLDIDLAVVSQDGCLSAVVDYKRMGAVCDVAGTNATALASLCGNTGTGIPAFMTRYTNGRINERIFDTYPLNKSARGHLSYVLGASGAPLASLSKAVSGDRWIRLTESQWLDVLRVARVL